MEEVRKLWELKKVTVLPVVIGALLRAVSDTFDKQIEKLGTTTKLEVIQKTALLGTARLVRNVLSRLSLGHKCTQREQMVTGRQKFEAN